MTEHEPHESQASAPIVHGKPPQGLSVKTITIYVAISVVMLLVGIVLGPPIKSWADARRASAVESGGESGTWYISQMHPWIIQPNPGQCPICGMDLTPVDPDRFAGEMAIDPVVVQNMGVRIAPAQEGNISRNIRTVGTVTVDEARITDVVQRFGGWIEEVYVAAQWNAVKKGEPLFRIYSPAVFAAEEEYLIARQGRGIQGGERLFAAAQQKLKLLAVPEQEMQRLQREGSAAYSIIVRSPASGVIWKKNINTGTEIAAKTVAYTIADLSSVWIEATLYENQLPFIHQGQSAQVRLDYGEQVSLDGTIDYIYPSVDPRTREMRARFVFANRMTNAGHALKPGMFATVFIHAQLAKNVTLIPHEAVIGTGARNIVFVSLGRGKFEPRTVTLGALGSDGMVAIADGIAIGEQVVTSGQFLLDSESKMREALAKVMKGDLASEQAPAASVVTGDVVTLPASVQATWKTLLETYLDLQQALYRGTALENSTAALKASAAAFIAAGKAEDKHFHHSYPAVAQLETEVQALDAQSAEALRFGFSALSITLDGLVKQFAQPVGLKQALTGMRCGMAKGMPKKGVWLQYGNDIQNPYYGIASDMRDCAADDWGLPQIGGQPAKEASPEKILPEKINAAAPQAQLNAPTIDAYLAVQTALYKNAFAEAGAASTVLMKALKDLGPSWTAVMHQAHAASDAADLKDMRIAWSGIGVAFKEYFAQHGNGGDAEGIYKNIKIYRCGMSRGMADKGVWLQGLGEPENPYFGFKSGMSDCVSETWSMNADGLMEEE